MARKVCQKCKREMEDTNFYTFKNGEKWDQCKSCLTMHIDNFNPDTFLWILEKQDVPYIPEEWNILRDKAYAKAPQKMNGMSVIGKYFSKMRLKQWKKYSWKDSEELQRQRQEVERARKKEEQASMQLIKEQYERGEISQAQYRTMVSTPFQKEHEVYKEVENPIGENNFFKQEDFLPEEDLPDLSEQLTLEEKQYLAMKWGRTYRMSELIQLQKKYTQMMNSFDIQDADSKNTLILLCKTDLKQNQAIDMGDYDGYQKLAKVSDSLRKSAKLTAAQNKDKDNEFVNSVGQLVAYCEKVGHQIPRYKIDTPLDIVDKVIKDLKEYNKSLIYGDSALARQIEDYIKNAKIAMEQKKDKEEAKLKGLDAPEVTDQDILNYKDFLQKEKEETQKQMRGEQL